MALKRKRSTDFIESSPASTSSTNSSLRALSQSPSPIPCPSFATRTITSPWPNPQNQHTSYLPPRQQDLNSRTHKRWRDLRPDAETVHAQTLQKLYDAQQIQPRASPAPPSITPLVSSAQQGTQKTSLHSFWNLPDARAAISSPVSSCPIVLPRQITRITQDRVRCEDCDSLVVTMEDDLDAMDLDVGQTGFAEAACNNCGKRVCDLCAVIKEYRICLECATEGGG